MSSEPAANADLSGLPMPVGGVNFGDLRRLQPISRVFGLDRGRPVDRYYIERFLEMRSGDVRGRVLEIGEDTYTRRFGGDRVTRGDVLHVQPGSQRATIVADLTDADHLPGDQFDCIILVQTLLCIYDVRAALRTLARVLAPGGILLATFPGISQISRYDADRWGDFWRFTTASARRLFAETFGGGGVEVASQGNVLAAVAFLHGLAAEELRPEELEYYDPDYELVITVRATKAGTNP